MISGEISYLISGKLSEHKLGRSLEGALSSPFPQLWVVSREGGEKVSQLRWGKSSLFPSLGAAQFKGT